jgi:pyruvate/2-oxoglutarate dehydrogenase complex dihydrolipoamide dehydrogenase (E3) component
MRNAALNHSTSATTNAALRSSNDLIMETQPYEIVIVGTGEGSKYLAWTLGKQGKRIAVIERKYIGGACPNIACLPSKNVIHSAKVASYFRRSEEFGIAKEGFRIDMSAVRDRKRKMVRDLVDIHVANFNASGAELIMGSENSSGPRRYPSTKVACGLFEARKS